MQRSWAITLLTGLCVIASGSLGSTRVFADDPPADSGAPMQPEATDVTLRVPGITVIGEIDNRLWAVTLSLLGCTRRSLGASPMTSDYAIHGTDSDDTINVLQAPLLWCNRLMTPPNQNGHALEVYGGAGNDILYGGGSAPFSGNPNAIFGEDGDDVLYLGPGGARGDGGPGSDMIVGGDSAGDVMLGGAGDDALCEDAATVALTLDGGDGEGDTSCSETASNGFTGIESTNCSRCAVRASDLFGLLR